MQEKALEIWVGIDVSKNTFDVAVYLPVKSEALPRDLSDLPKASFNRDPDGVRKFMNWVDELNNSFAKKENLAPAPNIRTVMEATGSYSLELVAWLIAERPESKHAVADPKRVNAFGKSLRMRNKTDRTDAALLARYGAERKPAPYLPQEPEYRALRELVRQRKAIVNMLTSARLQLDEPAEVKEVAQSRQKVVRDIKNALEKIEEAIRKHVDSHASLKKKTKRLESIPGVGFLTAATILAEVGEMARFATSKKLAAYSGVSPRIVESGASVKGRTRMCKEGQPRIRQALYLAALASIRGDNGFARFYKSLVAKGKSKMAAIGAVMRKLLCVMRALIIGNSEYRDELVSPYFFVK